MDLAAEDAEQGESLGNRGSLQACQTDQDGSWGANPMSPGGKGLGLGKEGTVAASPETVVTLWGGELQSPSPHSTGL